MRGKPINDAWKFTLEQPLGCHLGDFDDTEWRTINLPHDWSVEFPFDKEKGEACTGFLPGGIGWYRKKLMTTKEMMGNHVLINFDGIYNRASVYVNGKIAAFHPYGYSPLLIDLKDFLNPLGEENLIAVRVDHSRYADSRWYTGSGIYRKVALHILAPTHIPLWGMVINSKLKERRLAQVSCNLELINSSKFGETLQVTGIIYDQDKQELCRTNQDITVPAESNDNITLKLDIKDPILWDIFQGNLYKFVAEIRLGNRVIQRVEDNFGIRTFHFDASEGFFLNGKNTQIKGVCLHHDGGLVGAAVPLDVWKRRLILLKECGCNAIRTAHNPASEDFLDLCDSMGFLVQEEIFDEWDNPKDKRKNGVERSVDYITRAYTEHFRDYCKSDLQNTIKRDINHASIFQWSIGNEIEWTYTKFNDARGFTGNDAMKFCAWKVPPNNKEEIREYIEQIPRDLYDIDSTAEKLSRWVKELDTTRPVTANCILPSVSYESGYTDHLDLIGYSYRNVLYAYGKENYPEKPFMGTENFPQYHEWKAVMDHKHVAGLFLWTGIDHMGEAWVQKPWPAKGSNLGLLDFAGFKKPAFHLFKCLWSCEPHMQIYTQPLKDSFYKVDESGVVAEKNEGDWKKRAWWWHDIQEHWNYQDQEEIVIEVYSNLEEVELFLNDRSLGKRKLADFIDYVYKWILPFAEGELKAVGFKEGKKITQILKTSGDIKQLYIQSDKKSLTMDGDSVAHITTQFLDTEGIPVRIRDEEIHFEVSGDGRILGVDNGHTENVQDYQSDSIITNQGQSLMILQSTGSEPISVVAYCRELGLKSDKIEIE